MLTIELVRRLDAKKDNSVLELLRKGDRYEGPWPFILDEDYRQDELPALALKWEIPLDVLSQYIELATYIDQTAQMSLDPEFAQSPEQMADELGIDFAEFEPYFVQEVLKIRDALAKEDDEEAATCAATSPPWETEEDLLEDFQQDASLHSD
jgi:hypothetical protein